MSASSPLWVTDPDVLARHLATGPTLVGLDTEFIRERTYWPQLALVQLAIGADILLIDPLAPGMLQALRPLLTDPGIVKIMHSAGEDLIALHHSCGVAPQPLFDTQTAAALAGIAPGIGYQRLVQDLLDIPLSKGETRSDWLRRPLSDAQLAYAADDVRHLHALHARLSATLTSQGRMDWLQEDCARQVAQAADTPDRWPHLSLRAAQHFDLPARIRLLRLLRWRDRWARERDRPRNWVLDNELAMRLARQPPADPSALQQLLDHTPKAPRKLSTPLWDALHTPLDDEDQAPPPSANEEADRKQLRRLQEAVAAHSQVLGLPDGVLASRRKLEQLLERGHWPNGLSGWRRAELEPVLTPLLTGILPGDTPDV